MNTLNKDRPLPLVYKAVLTIFMLYVYGQNIDIILKRRQEKKATAKIVAKQAKKIFPPQSLFPFSSTK